MRLGRVVIEAAWCSRKAHGSRRLGWSPGCAAGLWVTLAIHFHGVSVWKKEGLLR